MRQSWSPSWTLGRKTELQQQKLLTPGPGAYEIVKVEIPELPSGRFGKSTRHQLSPKDNGVGPGQYTIPSSFESKPSKKPKKRNYSSDKTDKAKFPTPGPGAYNVKIRQAFPRFSMGVKTYELPSQTATREEQLGPGHYSPTIIDKSHSYSMGKAKRSSSSREVEEALRSYHLPETLQGPKYSFGTSQKLPSKSITESPAPWNYESYSFTDDKKGKTITGNHKISTKLSEVPGPGHYYKSKTVFNSPSYSMGHGQRQVSQSKNTGPGFAYDPQYPAYINKSSTFGTGKRPSITNPNKQFPGPGSYTLKSYVDSGPKHAMSGRWTDTPDKMMFPGPGQYKKDFASSGATCVIGTGGRSSLVKNRDSLTPGPGHYYSGTDGKLGPLWSFAKDKRTKMDESYNDEPGPGQYDVVYYPPDTPINLKS